MAQASPISSWMTKWYPVLAKFVLEQLAVIKLPGLKYKHYASATWLH